MTGPSRTELLRAYLAGFQDALDLVAVPGPGDPLADIRERLRGLLSDPPAETEAGPDDAEAAAPSNRGTAPDVGNGRTDDGRETGERLAELAEEFLVLPEVQDRLGPSTPPPPDQHGPLWTYMWLALLRLPPPVTEEWTTRLAGLIPAGVRGRWVTVPGPSDDVFLPAMAGWGVTGLRMSAAAELPPALRPPGLRAGDPGPVSRMAALAAQVLALAERDPDLYDVLDRDGQGPVRLAVPDHRARYRHELTSRLHALAATFAAGTGLTSSGNIPRIGAGPAGSAGGPGLIGGPGMVGTSDSAGGGYVGAPSGYTARILAARLVDEALCGALHLPPPAPGSWWDRLARQSRRIIFDLVSQDPAAVEVRLLAGPYPYLSGATGDDLPVLSPVKGEVVRCLRLWAQVADGPALLGRVAYGA